MRKQGVLTVVTEILPDRCEDLTRLLDDLDAVLDGDAPGQPIVDFTQLDSVHFARFAVLPEDAEGKRHLVFTTAYDGPRRFHLSELAKRARDGLCRIYEHCRDFPDVARTAPATFIAYLERHAVPHGAMHVGYVGRTVQDIRAEAALRNFIQQKLDETAPSTPSTGKRESATAVRKRIIRWVERSEHRAMLSPRSAAIERSSVEGWWKNGAIAAAIVSVIVAFGFGAFSVSGSKGLALYVATLLAGAALVLATLRSHESSEPAKEDTTVSKGLEHAQDEDWMIRNQLTHLVEVKPGLFRRVLLRVVLFAVELRARFEFYKGDLGGLETIHCAHWAILEGNRPRLLFISNYDGSWERYLGDFIEEAGGGMTSVWSNTVDYPRARFLLWDGATNERVFKAWTREKQVRTQVFYAAHPDISIKNVNSNSKLRDGLRGFMDEASARQWLKLL